MTEELLAEVVAKMNKMCKNAALFKPYTRALDGLSLPKRYWWMLRAGYPTQGTEPIWKQYSPMLSICQLVDWCEAWLKGANEIIAIFGKGDSQ